MQILVIANIQMITLPASVWCGKSGLSSVECVEKFLYCDLEREE